MLEIKDREKEIYRITLKGSVINLFLVIMKLVAGVVGHSAAMIADGIHSLSDLLTDLVVIIFVHLGNKPQDKTHDYGHGKYETLATAIIGIALFIVGLMILYNGVSSIWQVIHGATLSSPGGVAFAAAVISILLKEWCYQFTARAGKRMGSQALVANAWHHRSDALSSIGTALGIGGAILLGDKWTILDPIAAMVVGILILVTAVKLIAPSMDELLEKSLPDDVEDEITRIAESEPQVSRVHNLRTRRIGNHIAIEMHVRMPGEITLYESHQHAMHIEQKLKEKYGPSTHIGLHVEPLKVDGKYMDPRCEK